ncbi:hypothetical protein [Nocardioides sp. GXQ0305]|uniref:hypothetical protein n=1 Tax=Nocardioides sp. GXQ0305 TaxID=3423912 RepID=UPI003D7E82B7
MSEQPSGPRRARHLMDPTAPRRPPDPQAAARLARVQQWVVSVLAVTTIGHLCVGLVVAALFLPEQDTVARIGVCGTAGAFGVMAVVIARVIHRRRPVSPWLALGLLPAVIGVWLVLR